MQRTGTLFDLFEDVLSSGLSRYLISLRLDDFVAFPLPKTLADLVIEYSGIMIGFRLNIGPAESVLVKCTRGTTSKAQKIQIFQKVQNTEQIIFLQFRILVVQFRRHLPLVKKMTLQNNNNCTVLNNK